MVRLSAGMRNAIRHSILEAAFPSVEQEEFEQKEIELGEAVYAEKFGRYLGTMKRLPASLFEIGEWVDFSVGEGCSYMLPLKQPRIAAARDIEGWRPSQKLLARIRAHKKHKRERVDARRLLEANLRRLLDECSSEEELVKRWPNAKKYLGKDPEPTQSVVDVEIALKKARQLSKGRTSVERAK